MKSLTIIFLSLLLFSFTDNKFDYQENVEFVCNKTLKAKNECHYNFLVDGGKFRYVDVGCRRKKEDVIEKVKAGEIPLAKDWKLECPMPKKEEGGL
ncbi:MAG: hypothetical protein O9302_09850 [Cyclobacteriaceae bacterium]|jgi:hypothetical protein|nr:hypothetical protein [Cytophagales bacterium]MCZ8328350.1 hypothetical protein [Cyclobacteriaceae bacterium]